MRRQHQTDRHSVLMRKNPQPMAAVTYADCCSTKTYVPSKGQGTAKPITSPMYNSEYAGTLGHRLSKIHAPVKACEKSSSVLVYLYSFSTLSWSVRWTPLKFSAGMQSAEVWICMLINNRKFCNQKYQRHIGLISEGNKFWFYLIFAKKYEPAANYKVFLTDR